MTGILYIKWTAMAFFAWAIISAVQIPVRMKTGWVVRGILFAVKFVLMVLCAYKIMVGNGFITWQRGYLLGGCYLGLAGDLVSDLVTLPYEIVKKRKGSVVVHIVASLFFTIAIMLYGSTNMDVIKANRVTITSEKIKTPHKFVFLSDVHVGSAQRRQTYEQIVMLIEEEKPDFLVLGGDITDERTSKEDLKWFYNQIGKINCPVFFIYGNHDRQPSADLVGGHTYSLQDLTDAITNNGVMILDDTWRLISGDLIILGRDSFDSPDRLSPQQLSPRPSNAYVITFDHSPYEYEDIVQTGSDLQVSGHSHAGQIFPLRIVYDIAGYDVQGFYRHGNTDVYVSSGVGGWYVPIRTEGHCVYEVFTLLPKEGK
ncbi:MAG: metallophosphoesterase [Spirochaetales bacterium]|nr:metallophosphoesterase [Spirochaetales bacterium]